MNYTYPGGLVLSRFTLQNGREYNIISIKGELLTYFFLAKVIKTTVKQENRSAFPQT